MSESTASSSTFRAEWDRVVHAGGGTVRVPSGEVFLDESLQATTNGPISIIGEGIYNSKLIFRRQVGDGIVFSGITNVGERKHAALEVRNLAVLREGPGGKAIAIEETECPVNRSFAYLRFRIDNVRVSGANPAAEYWNEGLHLRHLKTGVVSNCEFEGLGTTTDQMDAVSFTGYSAEIVITTSHFQNVRSGVKAVKHSERRMREDGSMEQIQAGPEGITIDKCHMVNVSQGVSFEGDPMLIVADSHISTTEKAVVTMGTSGVVIRNNVIHHRDRGKGRDLKGTLIEVIGGEGILVQGNIIGDEWPEAPLDCIVITANSAVVQSNIIGGSAREKCSTGVWIKPGSTNIRIIGNRVYKILAESPVVRSLNDAD